MSISQCQNTYLRRVGAQAGLCGESLATNITMEWTILGPLYLRVMVTQMLLQIG